MISVFSRVDPARYRLADEVVDRVVTPALVVHLDQVRANVARIVALLDGRVDRWRPHVKTTKIPRVYAELLRRGVRRFKCATTREAHVLLATAAGEGVRDVDLLVAYPHVGPALRRFAAIARAHPAARVSVLVEDERGLADVPPELGVFLDLNPGMDRTGLDPAAWSRLPALAAAAGGRLRGLHCYDGHLHEADPEVRAGRIAEGHAALRGRVEALLEAGIAVEEVVTAGTPAFLASRAGGPLADLPGVAHRLSPGTVVFHDLRSEEENPGLSLAPAAVVMTRVVSHPRAHVVTCDAGSKSVAAEAGDPCAEVLGWPGLVARTPSEEHLPFHVARGPAPDRGDVLMLVPRHVCPTVNLAAEALIVDGGRVEVAPVAARAHDLWCEPDGELGRGPGRES